MNHDHEITKGLVRRVLRDACHRAAGRDAGAWTLQGLGMLRLYLDDAKTHRLHVWDERYATDASPMHTHPWHMLSHVVAGEVRQRRYAPKPPGIEVFAQHPALPYCRQEIQCGAGGGLVGTAEAVMLWAGEEEVYVEGRSYKQRADEIHVSTPLGGTCTIVTRQVPSGENPDQAFVFWPLSENWKTAEPRAATADEVLDICAASLDAWF